ncbi:hypothetical protein ACHAXH_000186, partial [Discostella pseudostelligera]
FTSHLDIIGHTMKEAGHSFVRIDGSVCAANRISAISRFNSDAADAPRFILCSLLASGTGINLTRGNWCFMMDVWWNDAVESQAMDRIHRISQTRKVHVLRFVMKNSIEERIIGVQERKSLQAKSVVQKLKGDEKRKERLFTFLSKSNMDHSQFYLDHLSSQPMVYCCHHAPTDLAMHQDQHHASKFYIELRQHTLHHHNHCHTHHHLHQVKIWAAVKVSSSQGRTVHPQYLICQ